LVTAKDELHALVDRLLEPDAQEALEYLRARIESTSRPSQAFIDESRRALDEALAPDSEHVPHTEVRAWLETWGMPEEAAGEAAAHSRNRGQAALGTQGNAKE
jgi:predicted transcriptional regulator